MILRRDVRGDVQVLAKSLAKDMLWVISRQDVRGDVQPAGRAAPAACRAAGPPAALKKVLLSMHTSCGKRGKSRPAAA